MGRASQTVGGEYMSESIGSIPEGIFEEGEGPGSSLEAGASPRVVDDLGPDAPEELGHPHAQVGAVKEIRRRRSPIDPPDGSWALIGAGVERSTILDALAGVDIPAVGYEKNHGHEGDHDEDHSNESFDQLVRFDHLVVSVDEIDDIESLAVTSWDRLTGEINTDYFAGIVVATTSTRFCGDLVDPADAATSQTRRVFTAHHPAVLLVGPAGAGAGTNPAVAARAEADFAAEYAKLLADSPRAALSFHRRVCSRADLSHAVSPTVTTVGTHEPTISLRRLLVEVVDLDETAATDGLS